MFNINAAALPTLRTRQALLILDLQNEFLSPDGNLTVNQPDALVSRITNLAKAFRLSGAGDVVWVRSQFDVHRPLSGGADGGDQIITTDAPVVPRRTTSGRGRPPTSGRHEEAVMEADGEAFLSYPPASEKPRCVQKDSKGAELGPEVQAAVDSGRDITFTKTHYSAFAVGAQQLVQMLRGRFVTEIYLCGALTNISIYATALDAGRHGYDITLVDDCCGYRSDMRHSNAVHRLVSLTGCEVTTSSDVIAKLAPERPSSKDKRRSRGAVNIPDMLIPISNNSREAAIKRSRSRSRSRKPAVGQPSPENEDEVAQALPSSLEKLTLSGDDSSTAPAAPPPPPSGSSRVRPPQDASEAAQQPVQAMVTQAQTRSPTNNNTATPPVAPVANVRHQTRYVDSAPLEVDPDLSAGQTSPGGSVDDLSRRMEQFDITQKLSYIRSNVRGPPRVRIPPNSSLAAGSAARSAAAAKAKLRSRQPATPPPPDASGSTEPKDIKPLAPSEASGLKDPKDIKPATQPSAPAMDEPSHPTPTTSPPLCEGDTTIIFNLLPPSLADNAFTLLNTEVQWARMSHQGGSVPRLVAVQGHISSDGSFPAYRHPSDESPPLLPFSPTVLAIKSEVEKQVGHPLNHVLIQSYRDGNDYISEHSDKTLDIVKGSFIANVSLGAERTMIFRTKRGDKDKDPSRNKSTPTSTPTPTSETEAATPQPPRRIERAPLPHNSLVRMGLATNMKWLHAIRADKRLDRDKTPAELAYSGQRISLTFRHIGTFLNAPQTHIWGQGATSKTKDSARQVINGQTPEAVKMLQAFGTENHASEFDWERVYGAGFDVLNIKAAARLFSSADGVVNVALALQLADLGLGVAKGSTGADGLGTKASVKFVDNDEAKSSVEGWMAVMLYLDAVYGGERRNQPPVARDELARRLTRFQAATGLLDRWRGYLAAETQRKDEEGKKLRREMEVWDGYAAAAAAGEDGKGKGGYIAGGERASIADFAFWPVLHDIMLVQRDVVRHCRHLEGYYERVKGGKAAVKVLGGASGEVKWK
ncbi:hypothetical protein GE09DRAFT_1138145 [Coniochaeta sp. 2T2.1]|nr:hypothetical protein GE09DRAFT_1138145 [Coniochaeta sp. 2T2.1]